MSFCAICTDDITAGAGVVRPLGRNNADVTICASCDEDDPSSGRYSFGGGRAVARTGLTGSHSFATRATRRNGAP